MASLSPDMGSPPVPAGSSSSDSPLAAGAPATPIALSVVVPVFNGADTIAEQLDALVTQQWTEPWEIVVVDNGSTDGTHEIAARYAAAHDRLRVVVADEQHSVAYARNIGVAASRGVAVAFADADDIVAEGWVAAIGDALRDHALVGSRLEHDRLGPPGATATQTEVIGRFFGLPCLAGAGHGVQRWLYERLDGNDESWSGAGEDFDFAFRAYLEEGIEPVFVDGALYHYRRRTDARSAFRQCRSYGRSHVRLYERYGNGDPAQRERVRTALKVDLWLLAHAYHLLDPGRRLVWARKAGTRVGRIQGSIHHRVLYL